VRLSWFSEEMTPAGDGVSGGSEDRQDHSDHHRMIPIVQRMEILSKNPAMSKMTPRMITISPRE
jgi:hypothetical protein